MTKYGEVIRRVLDNADIDNENSNKRSSIRRDIEDVLNDMYLNTESPITTTTYTVKEQAPNTVSDKIEINQTYTLPAKPTSMKSLSITAQHEGVIVGTTDIKLLIANSFGVTLFDKDFVVTDQDSITVDMDIVFTDLVGATLTLTSSSASGTVNFTMVYNTDVAILELDPSIYVPFEVVFKVSEKNKSAIYNSKELLEEEFMRWNPNGASDLNSEVLSAELKSGVTEPTIENLEFDYNVGYFFKMGETNLELHFKPATQCVAMIRHSYLPTTSINETSLVPLHRAFNNCLVYGTTLKQLEKKLMRATTEIDIVKIRTAIARYAPQYAQAVSHYAGFNRRTAKVHVIKMFGVCDDPDMMR